MEYLTHYFFSHFQMTLFHEKCRRLLTVSSFAEFITRHLGSVLNTMWVARPAGMVPLQFLTFIILTLSQQRIWWCVEFSVSLPRKILCWWWECRLWVSLGEQSRACGPWKLSNNNSAAAKSPHLRGHTTLSCWFLSICSPTHPNIPANCCGSSHQCWSCRIAEVLIATQRHRCRLCASFASSAMLQVWKGQRLRLQR